MSAAVPPGGLAAGRVLLEMPELEPEPERGDEWAPSPWSSDPYSDAIAALKAEDFGIPLQYNNFRD